MTKGIKNPRRGKRRKYREREIIDEMEKMIVMPRTGKALPYILYCIFYIFKNPMYFYEITKQF